MRPAPNPRRYRDSTRVRGCVSALEGIVRTFGRVSAAKGRNWCCRGPSKRVYALADRVGGDAHSLCTCEEVKRPGGTDIQSAEDVFSAKLYKSGG